MPRGRPAKYPWPELLNGARHVLKQSDDWERDSLDTFPSSVKPSSFRAECHAAARRKGGKADTRIMGNSVILRFLEED